MCMRRMLIALITVSLCLLLGITAYAAEVTITITPISQAEGTGESVPVEQSAGSVESGQSSDTIGIFVDNAVENMETHGVTAVPIIETMTGHHPINIEVINENGVPVIKKTFEVAPGTNPQTLVQPFEQNGYRFTVRETLNFELPGEVMTRRISKTAVTMTDHNDAAEIMRQFPFYIDYADRGYTGQLFLDVSTINTRADRTEPYTYTFTRTREITGLIRNDPALIDRTWNGMTLSNVSFTNGMGRLYTAIATYTGTGTGRRTVSYVTTAVYSGNISMTMPGNMLYTIVYVGTPIEVYVTPSLQTEQSDFLQAEPPIPPDEADMSGIIEPEIPAPPNETHWHEDMSEITAPEHDVPVNVIPTIPYEPTGESTLLERLLDIHIFPIVFGVIFLIGAVIMPIYLIAPLRKERNKNREAIKEIKKFISNKGRA